MEIAESRRIIPAKNLVKFKQLFKGLEIDRVLGERVLVHEVEAHTALDEAYEKAGIVAPEQYWDDNSNTYRQTQKGESCAGLVMQVGPDVNSAIGVVEGAMVLFSEYGGNKYVIGGVKVRVLDADEIICTLRAVKDVALTEVVAPVKEKVEVGLTIRRSGKKRRTI